MYHCFPLFSNSLGSKPIGFQLSGRNLFEDVHAFQIELEIENVGFRENQSTEVVTKHSEKRLEPNKPN